MLRCNIGRAGEMVTVCLPLCFLPSTHRDIGSPSSWYLHPKTPKCSRTRQPFSAALHVEKALNTLNSCVNTCMHFTKRPSSHRDICSPSSWCLHHKTPKCSRTRHPFSAVFHVSKRLYSSVLVQVFILQNDLVLTSETCSPPPGTCIIKTPNARKCASRFQQSFAC